VKVHAVGEEMRKFRDSLQACVDELEASLDDFEREESEVLQIAKDLLKEHPAS